VRRAAIRSFRALSHVHYAGPKEQLHVKEVLAISRPNHLRIEMMSPFGVALQITSDGERISAYHRGERTFYRGKATAENLSRFTRLELDVADVADLLLGFPVKRARKGRPELSFESPQGSWRVSTSLADGGSLIVWFDADSLLPVRAAEADSRAGIRYTASYASYTMVSGVAVPTEVRFEIPTQGAKIHLRYADISVNVDLPPQLFTFEAPAGSKIVDLDALAAGLKE